METDRERVARSATATVVGELVFSGRDHGFGVAAVTPLVSDGRVVIALPYAHRSLADALAAADHVALVLSDDRMALRDWEPLVATGRIEVVPDRDGARFRDRLLEQELRKHPPSRVLADSLRDRRDHWWYLPRLLCHLDVDTVRRVGRRSDPTTGVLAWGSGELDVDAVEVTDADEGSVTVRSLEGRRLAGTGEPALLFRHDYSQPDLERRSERRETGHLEGEVLRCTGREGDLVLPEPPGLFERVRRHRTLSKVCRRELARAR